MTIEPATVIVAATLFWAIFGTMAPSRLALVVYDLVKPRSGIHNARRAAWLTYAVTLAALGGILFCAVRRAL